MKKICKSQCILATCLAPFLILFLAKSVTAQEVGTLEAEDEREFDYSKNGAKGPQKWGKLKKEWADCSKGTRQSPIDMSNPRVRIVSKKEKRNYKASNATVKNRGHDIQIQWFGDTGSVFIKGANYSLKYAHWHSPSEHTINGRRYDMELHMVHASKEPDVKNKIAVIGFLYKIGKPDKFLPKLTSKISSMMDEEKDLGMVHPDDITSHGNEYYRYMGSLTIPPCTQGVVWTINTKVRTVSKEQLHMLREAVHDYAQQNARPLQKVNNRDIFLYGP